MKRSAFRFQAEVAATRRGWLGVKLPPGSAEWLGTRGQVRIAAIINAEAFSTTAFPSGEGRHVVLVNERLRRRLGVEQGDSVDVELRLAAPRTAPAEPADLREVLSVSEAARRAWDALTPAARRVALTWIDHAKSAEVRAWRIADVLRRAGRYAAGEGPFYPTKEDQRLLGRPRRSAD
jgi:hypothetical protein